MRRQCRRFEFQRILLPVRMRIHWGMGRFWAIFFASVRFVRNVLCDGCGGARRVSVLREALRALATCVCSVPPIRGGGGETRRPAALFGVGQSAGPPLRSAAAPARVRDFCATTQQFVCGSRWAPELLARKPRAAPQPLQKHGAEAGPRSLTAAFRCKPACEAIDSVVVMSRRRRMRNETYHGCQIAASLFCARQTSALSCRSQASEGAPGRWQEVSRDA